MRILQVTDTYPPVLGGLELHVQQLAIELALRNHQVDVATLSGVAPARTVREGAVTVHRIGGWSRVLEPLYADPTHRFHPTVPDPGMMWELASIIRGRKIEVVHAHSWIVNSLLPLLPTRRTKLVVTMHDYGLVCPKKTMVFRTGAECTGPRFDKCVACARLQYGAPRSMVLTSGLSLMSRLHGRVGCYVAVSRAVARACQGVVRHGQPPIRVIPPFVPDDVFQAGRSGRPGFVPQEGQYLMFAGALTHHKGLDVLLEAWSGVAPAVPLVLAGLRWPESPTRFPAGVHLAENVPRSDVLRAWAHSIAGVVPSTWPEPHALVAMEAMAAGRPVVASRVGGLADIVTDGVTGLLVSPGNVPELQAALQRVVDDPEGCARMGTAAREDARRFRKDVIVPQIEQVYRDVIASPVGRSA